MYGNVTLEHDLTIITGSTLVIPGGSIVTIPSGILLINNGRISVAHATSINGTITGNPVLEPSLTISGGSSYTYQNRTLTITGSGTYTIGMKDGVTQTDLDQVVVASGVTADITLQDLRIDVSARPHTCAFDMSGATVYLTLKGTNILKSGDAESGLEAPRGSTLVITAASTGSLEAISDGQYGAGIGAAGMYADGGTIIINGGVVTAVGSGRAAGIGGGFRADSGTISIANAVVFASSIVPALTTGGNVSNAIVFKNTVGTVYGSVTLQQDFAIPNTHTLGIASFSALTIPGGVNLTNDGTIVVYHGGILSGTVAGNQPVDSDLTITGGSSCAYAEGILTITGDGTYTIAMRSGVSGPTTDRIVVASGVNAAITLNGVNIDVSGIDDACAFDMTGATVSLTLGGNNVLKSRGAGLLAPEGSTLTITTSSTGSLDVTGGDEGAGIGGGSGGDGGTVTITGGTVTATSGSYGAGIGGGDNGAGGTISISGGTVTATGGLWGAGIGGGMSGDGGTIAISGGTVTATGDYVAAGIGGGNGGDGGTITELSGNAVVSALSIGPTLTAGVNATRAIVFDGNTGTVYGGVTLQQDLAVQSAQILSVPASSTLTVPANVTLTNEGKIVVYPGGTLTGTVAGNQPIGSDMTISGGSSYTYVGGVLTITGNVTYTIGMESGVSTTTDHIVVAAGVNAAITLSSVNIDSGYVASGATVTLTLIGTNILQGFLEVSEGSNLTIRAENETNTLNVTGGYGRAGIDGGGTITINGGTITATGGGGGGAGIGGAGGTISISGGTVTAKGGPYGAGIGGGFSNDGGTISISGGMVTAIGGSMVGSFDLYGGAGIGGGSGGAGGTISISGGTITATGGYNGAGIGGGDNGAAGTITALSGNAVVFASSIQPTLTAGDNATQAIAFNGNAGTMYGNVTLGFDVTIPSTHTLDLSSGQTLTIPGGVTLTNEGTINKNGGTISGNVGGSGTVNN
jgi:hypothetical protein